MPLSRNWPARSDNIWQTSPSIGTQASAVRLKAATARQLWLIAGAILAVVLVGGYFFVDKAWRSKHETTASTAVISDKSIAVLPFADMSEKKDQEYFADGMAEKILDLLAKIPGLKVIVPDLVVSVQGQDRRFAQHRHPARRCLRVGRKRAKIR